MRQRIERTCFECPSMKELITKVNEFTATISVGNVMDTSIEMRMVSTDIKKYEGVTEGYTELHRKLESIGSYKHEREEYTYLYTAVVTVLHEE